MNVFMNNLSTVISIIGVLLTIYFYFKSRNATCDKARQDIIKTLFYRLDSKTELTEDEIISVYKSKLREHKINKPNFNKNDILDDLRSEIMSNPFLANDRRNTILYNLYDIYFESKKPMFTRNPVFRRFFYIFVYFIESPLPILLILLSAICVILSLFTRVSLIVDILTNIEDIHFNDYLATLIYECKNDRFFMENLLVLSILTPEYIVFRKYIHQYMD